MEVEKNRHVKRGQTRKYKCLNSSCGKSFFAESGLAQHGKECHQLPTTQMKYENLKVEIDPDSIKCEDSDPHEVLNV